MAKYVTALWILLGAAQALRTALHKRPLSRREAYGWIAAFLGLAILSIRQEAATDAKFEDVERQLRVAMSQIREVPRAHKNEVMLTLGTNHVLLKVATAFQLPMVGQVDSTTQDSPRMGTIELLSDGAVKLDLDIKDRDLAVVAQVRDSKLKILGEGYDSNGDIAAMEVVDPERRPVFQLIVDPFSDLSISITTYITPWMMFSCFSGSQCRYVQRGTEDGFPPPPNLRPIFWYPSYRYPGKRDLGDEFRSPDLSWWQRFSRWVSR